MRYLGLSGASPEEVRRAHAVHPVSAVQLEWSLWRRDCEDELVPLCRELGIGVVAHAPHGRGFLTGKVKTPEDLAEEDWRQASPGFHDESFNKVGIDGVGELGPLDTHARLRMMSRGFKSSLIKSTLRDGMPSHRRVPLFVEHGPGQGGHGRGRPAWRDPG